MAKARGVLLYSGGLDSIIAAKVLMMQDLELIAFHCLLPFLPPDLDTGTLDSARIARQIGLPVVYHRLGDDYIDVIRDPSHGYGKNMNPCIDCKIHFIKKAAEYMKETGADFVATGEVVGQRPMSQMKHMLVHIARESGIEERLIRPLSAKILKPTLPEEQGLIDRQKLLALSGRSRKEQINMAAEYGIKDYSSPAGGCLFTDPNISKRVKDLFLHHDPCTPLDLYLLTLGRHFRLSSGLKLVVSRNHLENIELEKYLSDHDCSLVPEFQGPMAVFKGRPEPAHLDLACALIARYSKNTGPGAQVNVFQGHKPAGTLFVAGTIPEADVESMRI